MHYDDFNPTIFPRLLDKNAFIVNMRYILISKKQYTFLYVYKYITYRVVLIPNYKHAFLTINTRAVRMIRSKNKFELFIENWSYSFDQ